MDDKKFNESINVVDSIWNKAFLQKSNIMCLFEKIAKNCLKNIDSKNPCLFSKAHLEGCDGTQKVYAQKQCQW